MFPYLLVLGLVTAALAAPKHSNVGIVGGQPANIKDYPYQVALFWYGMDSCGGSILDATHILTAAHCTYGSDATEFKIRAGSDQLHSGGVTIDVIKKYEHPSYNVDNQDYDVAVLELAEPLTFSTTIATIKLGDAALPDGTEVQITGWGFTDESNVESSEQLRVVTVPIMSRAECTADYKEFDITSRMICAGYKNGGKDSCHEDSGGPLVSNGVQYGIVSWGEGCAEANHPGIYTSIPVVRDFINSVLKQSV